MRKQIKNYEKKIKNLEELILKKNATLLFFLDLEGKRINQSIK